MSSAKFVLSPMTSPIHSSASFSSKFAFKMLFIYSLNEIIPFPIELPLFFDLSSICEPSKVPYIF